MPPLTKKGAEMLSYIREHIRSHGYAPSYREIADHFSISSPATVHQHVKTLVEKGVIRMGEDGEARSIEIMKDERRAESAVLLPLAGLITAGASIEAAEGHETTAGPAPLVLPRAN